MNEELRTRLLGLVKPDLRLGDQRAFDVTVQVLHASICKSHNPNVSRPAHLESLVYSFMHFFSTYGANLALALDHAESVMKGEDYKELLWGAFLNRLHLYVSDAYQFYVWGWDVTTMQEADPYTTECIGAPVSMAQGLIAIATWADSHGEKLLGRLASVP